MVSLENIDVDKINFDKASGTKEDFVEWMEKHGDKFDSFRELWLDVETKVISTVENPSHDSKIVQVKSENDDVENPKEKSVDVLSTEKYTSKTEDKNIIVAPAMVSNEKDKDGDIVPDYVVEESAHKFLKEKRVDEIDYNHETRTGSDRSLTKRGKVVESWIQQEEKEYESINGESKTYGSGDWMVAIELNSKVLDKVKSGEVNGLSMMGIPKEMVDNKSTSSSSKNNTENEDKKENPLQMEQDNKNMDKDKSDKETDEFDIDEFETKELSDEDINGIIADYYGIGIDEVSDMIDELVSDDEPEEESEDTEETKEDTETVSEDTEETKEDTETVSEEDKEQKDEEDDPCWDGYEQVGMKPDPNGDGKVPNCVPKDQVEEYDEETEDTETEKMDMEKITDMLEEVLDRVEDLEEDFYDDDEDTEPVEEEESEETQAETEDTETVDEKDEVQETEDESEEKTEDESEEKGYVPVWEREADKKNVTEGTQKSDEQDDEDVDYTDWY